VQAEEHKDTNGTQKQYKYAKNKTLSNQNKHDMAEENSTKKCWGKRPNPEKQI
jgi:hypothetical protein